MQQTYDQAVELASVSAATGGEAVTLSAVAGLPAVPEAGIQFYLQVATAAEASGDLLEVKVQTRIGATWYDVAYFTQVTGEAADAYAEALTAFSLTRVTGGSTVVTYTISDALTAGNVREVFGDAWRVWYQVTDAGSLASLFTFKVYARAI